MSVADLLERLQANSVPGGAFDWRSIRDEIHAEHDRAATTKDRETLLSVHKAVMDLVERNMPQGDDLEKFRTLRSQDYNLLLIKEAMIGDTSGIINQERMAEITSREVAAGRMSPHDELHKLAVKPPKVSLFKRLFG